MCTATERTAKAHLPPINVVARTRMLPSMSSEYSSLKLPAGVHMRVRVWAYSTCVLVCVSVNYLQLCVGRKLHAVICAGTRAGRCRLAAN